jgi:DNA-directed RNA polymerase subunit omega
MNSELCKQALTKVGDPTLLVNVISRRVRQLNTPGSPSSRPLIAETTGLGLADIALLEIIEEKIGFERLEAPKATETTHKRRKKH